jgi:hypothetical protein
MAQMLNVSIDVTKIDKEKLIKGEKGTYLNLTISVNDDKDNYGNDVSAWQGQTKEEVADKATKNYLGNGRVFWSGNSGKHTTHNIPNPDPNDDLLPF